jgi:hypothetical protein
VQFKIGVFKGFSKGELQAIWDNREIYRGQYIRYVHQKYGQIDRPRQPRGLEIAPTMDGFRDPSDM